MAARAHWSGLLFANKLPSSEMDSVIGARASALRPSVSCLVSTV
ncbi:hypothetical protein GGR09_000617 [Bartonella heixiaziensis]